MDKKPLLRKFLLLTWKNWTVQIRHPWQTLIEVLVPIIITVQTVFIRSLVDPVRMGEVHYNPYQPGDMNGTVITPIMMLPPVSELLLRHSAIKSNAPFTLNWDIAWSPHCAELEKIMDTAIQILSYSIHPVSFEGVSYPDSTTMCKTLTDPLLDKINTTFAGVAFQDDVCKNDVLNKKNLKMIIRFPAELRGFMQAGGSKGHWQTNQLFPFLQTLGPREEKDDKGKHPGYWYQGFLGLQHAIFSALVVHNTREENISTPDVLLQIFPYPSYVEDNMLYSMQSVVSITFMTGFMYNCFATVRAISIEKELQLKETMKIMGLPSWLHWTAWFIKIFMFQMTSVIIIVILLKVPWYPDTSFSVFTFTNWSVLLVFLMLFMVATICFDFMISVFFSKATTAALFAGILWFLSYAPFLFLRLIYDDLKLSYKLLSSLASNVAMGFGFNVILSFEGTGL